MCAPDSGTGVFVKPAALYTRNINPGNLEIGGKFKFTRRFAAFYLFSPHTLENPPTRDVAIVQADFMNR